MRRFWFLLSGALATGLAPLLACGPLAMSQVTPTPTKTPKRVLAIEQTRAPAVTPAPLPTATPIPLPPTATPTPPPTATPLPLPPTATPTPPPTDTPLPPPPPPTNTPAPPPPTDTPAPPPPTPPPANPLEVVIELPDGNQFSVGDEVRIVFVARDPNGVANFTWGIFLQNQTPVKNGKKECNRVTECREEVRADAPIEGTYILGADALNVNGQTKRGIGEIYVTD